MEKQPTTKILVGYHQPAAILRSDIFQPIHLGRAVAHQVSKDGMISEKDYRWMLDNTIGDDTGDNISHENRYINELTAHYWAWKNYDKLGDPDYIGFCHYRRYFIADASGYKNLNKQFPFESIYEIQKRLLANFNLGNYDCIVPYRENVKKRGYASVLDQFSKSKGHCIDDLLKTIDYVGEKYPDMAEALHKYFDGEEGYYYNIFIMRREIFADYAKFIFDVKDFVLRIAKEGRRPAYVLERITGFYLYFLTKTKSIRELPVAYIKTTTPVEPIQPIFGERSIPIVFCSDNNYLPYTAVAIQSIIANSDSSSNLDIVIIAENISTMNQAIIKRMQSTNISIRLYTAPTIWKDLFYVHGHFSKATYFRLFIGEIFRYYSKVIYLDSDIIVHGNISNLYSIDIGRYYVGAANAIGPQCYYHHNNSIRSLRMNMHDYWDKILKIKDCNQYFNAGVMIFNIGEFNRSCIVSDICRAIKEIKDPVGVDQDILNHVLQGKVKIISNIFNHIDTSHVKDISLILPRNTYEDYLKGIHGFVIWHYADVKKPWKHLDCKQSDLWWHYARISPFYEIILFKNFMEIPSGHARLSNGKLVQYEQIVETDLKRLCYKYLIYKVLTKISFGSLKKRAQLKLRKYQQRLISQ